MSKADYYIELWKAVIGLRDPFCICGAIATDCHHIFFKSQGDWVVLYDYDYGIKLCHDCHEEKEYAPHKDNELFFDKLIPILLQKDPERARKILTYKNSIKKPQPLPPQWKFISKTLRAEKKRLEKTAWMDDGIDSSRGASI